jgi:hypothetical protein
VPPSTSWPLAAAAALVALAALTLAFRGLSRAWPEHLPWGLSPIAIPAATLVWIVLFLPAGEGAAHNAAALAAVRADPFLLFDASPITAAGCFHLLAWPLARLFGDASAVRAVAALAFAIALLLAHAPARGLGAGPWTAFLAQALVLATPEMREPLVSGRFPAVLGTAGELAVLAHLVRRLPVLEAARDGAAACAFLFGAQALYVGAIPVTLALVLAVVVGETVAGHRRRGRWLLGAYGIALGLVILTQYAWSVPALAREGASPLAALGHPPAGIAPLAVLWRPDTALRVALAASLLVTRAAGGASLRAHIAALAAAVLVVATAAGLPARLGLEGHALAFAAAPLASLAAVGAAGLARRSRVLAVVATAAAIIAMVAGAGSAGHCLVESSREGTSAISRRPRSPRPPSGRHPASPAPASRRATGSSRLRSRRRPGVRRRRPSAASSGRRPWRGRSPRARRLRGGHRTSVASPSSPAWRHRPRRPRCCRGRPRAGRWPGARRAAASSG